MTVRPLLRFQPHQRFVGRLRELEIVVVVWAVPATFMVLQMYATALINGTPLPGPRALVPAVTEWLVWIPLTPLAMWLARRYPLHWPPTARSVGVHVLGVVAASFVRGVTYGSTTFLIGRVTGSVPFAGYVLRIWIVWLPIGALVWGAILAASAALDSAKRLKDKELRDAALREQLARAELGALKARLQPHFLFNALHSVGALVRGGENTAAVRVVADLSELLRDVLSRDAPELVRLREELAFVRRYLDIESVRFADRLRIEWEVTSDAEEAVVPSLVVQPLVENAIHHAISATLSAGSLRISARRLGDELAIDVSDDGPGVDRGVRSGKPGGDGNRGSSGIGLADTRARLVRLYGDRSSVTLGPSALGGTTASLRLPFQSSFGSAQ